MKKKKKLTLNDLKKIKGGRQNCKAIVQLEDCDNVDYKILAEVGELGNKVGSTAVKK